MRITDEVATAPSLNGHKVVHAARNRDVKVDLDDPGSAMSGKVRSVDAGISCADNAAFKPFTDLADGDCEIGFRSKLMRRFLLALLAKDRRCDGGSITATTGTLSMRPMRFNVELPPGINIFPLDQF